MRRTMIAGCIVLSLVGAAIVQAAEGESYVTVAQADGNVSQASVDRANDLLNVMPKNLLDGFLDNGWTFYVTDKNIAYDILGGQFNSVKGVTDFDNHEIYIEQRDAAMKSPPPCGDITPMEVVSNNRAEPQS